MLLFIKKNTKPPRGETLYKIGPFKNCCVHYEELTYDHHLPQKKKKIKVLSNNSQ